MGYCRAVTTAVVLLATSLCMAQPEARRERLHADYDHDAWDTQPKDIIREFRAYTTSFDGPDDNDFDGRTDAWAVPEWVSYELRKAPDRPEYEPRPSTWHTDAELYEAGIAPRDQSYVGSGYDRGHLCMRNHARRLGQNADWNSHSLLNAVPQEHDFNDGHWVSLEKWCAIWANSYERIWVICGPIMQTSGGSRRPYGWIGGQNEKSVAIPHQLFKIVVKESDDPNRPDVLAFIYRNDPSLNDKSLDANHRRFLKPVREIEEATGLDFFASLSAADQRAIESEAASSLWPGQFLDERRRGLLALDDSSPVEVIEELYDADSATEAALII